MAGEIKYLLDLALKGDYQSLEEKFQHLDKSVNLNNIETADGFSLLHLAVQSNSFECVRTVLDYSAFNTHRRTESGLTPLTHALRSDCSLKIITLLTLMCPELINIPDNHLNYPIHYAFNHSKILDVINILVAKAKDKGILLNDYINDNNRNGIFLAVSYKQFDVLKFFVENTSFNVHYECNRENAFQYAISCGYGNSKSEMMDYLFSLIYGNRTGMINELFINYIKMTTMHVETDPCIDWLVKNIYLHETNDLKSIVSRLEKFSVHHLNVYHVLAFIHSDFRHIKPNDEELEDIFWTTNYINFMYERLWKIFIIDEKLFIDVCKVLNDIWLKEFINLENWDSITFPINIFGNNYSKMVKFLDFIQIKEFYFLFNFDDDQFTPAYLKVMPALMPFVADSCADDFFLRVVPIEVRDQVIEEQYSIIEKYVGWTYHKGPMSLAMISRLVIRKTVFDRSCDLSNGSKLKNLEKLELPITLKNFLFFNYTDYNLF